MSDDIRYLCYECRKKANMVDTGFFADNYAGRKSCDNCGSNVNELHVFGVGEFEKIVAIVDEFDEKAEKANSDGVTKEALDKIGHSKAVVQDYHRRVNEDYKKLLASDKKIIDEIEVLLKKLSEDGRDYWDLYYT